MDVKTFTIEVGEDFKGKRLDSFLAKRYHRVSRVDWQSRIAQGLVLLNSKKCKSAAKIKAEDNISITIEKTAEPNVDSSYSIEYEDDDLLIVNKPANLPVHPAGRYLKNTLSALLKEHEQLDSVHIINRLDRETSGLMAVAKTKKAAAEMQKLQKAGKILKEYLVLVAANVKENFTATGFIGRDVDSIVEKKMLFVKENRNGFKKCSTDFTVLQSGSEITLLKARLHSGRMHQIRTTLHSLGFPVVGDKIYGADVNFYLKFISDRLTKADRQILRLPRQALHCHHIAFTHPKKNTNVDISTDMPQEFSMIL